MDRLIKEDKIHVYIYIIVLNSGIIMRKFQFSNSALHKPSPKIL